MTDKELLAKLLDEVSHLNEIIKRQDRAIELLVDDRQCEAYKALKGQEVTYG